MEFFKEIKEYLLLRNLSDKYDIMFTVFVYGVVLGFISIIILLTQLK